MVLVVEVGSGVRAVTGEGVRIEGKSSWAGNTSVGVRVPESWSIAADAIVASVDVGQSSWADTRVSIVDVVGGTDITSLSVGVPP